jgi:hypothetical protein
VPPYGSVDIPGSDTASKLIVNRPNGNTVLTMTGDMNGLSPLTTYTVYVSNGYTPYVNTGWDITGTWEMQALGAYDHDCTLAQSDTAFTGTCDWPAVGPYSIHETITGIIDPMTGAISSWHGVYYPSGSTAATGYEYEATGTIQADGKFVGSVADNQGNSGSWNSISGAAQKTHTGDTYWPGLFPTVSKFTFTTDKFGSGNWHVNLKDANFSGPGIYPLSIWINGAAGTILISDTFDVKV